MRNVTGDLLSKLGWRPDMDAVAVGRPPGLCEPLPAVELATHAHDLVLVFVSIPADVSRAIAAASHYRDGDRLWCAYRHDAAELGRGRGWEALGALGFHEAAHAELDADWDAVRFKREGERA